MRDVRNSIAKWLDHRFVDTEAGDEFLLPLLLRQFGLTSNAGWLPFMEDAFDREDPLRSAFINAIPDGCA
jgi:hypothetical protein